MHPIKRFLLIGLFGFGTVAGFAHGFAHLGHCHAARRAAWEDHVADVCTASAERVISARAATVAAPAAAPTTTITIAAPATVTVGSAAPAAAPVAPPVAIDPAVAPAAPIAP